MISQKTDKERPVVRDYRKLHEEIIVSKGSARPNPLSRPAPYIIALTLHPYNQGISVTVTVTAWFPFIKLSKYNQSCVSGFLLALFIPC